MQSQVDPLRREIREKGGIEAYDCVHHEVVLLLPWVLGMNGDNPMQSEFACHAGLKAKFFCRMCWVKGPDAHDGRGVSEPITVMIDRIKCFMKVSEL